MSRRLEYVEITETPGQPASRVQLERLHDRYRFAARHTGGGRVLEVACGPGIGLSLLESWASFAVGGDIDATSLAMGRGQGHRLVRLDAMRLPFRDGSFDLVYIAEAIYYLPDAAEFAREVARVLAPRGRFAVTSVNPAWAGWIASPYSVRYYSAPELAALMRQQAFAATAYGAFPDDSRGRVIALARRVFGALNLIPGSLAARAWLKRIVYGAMRPLPERIAADGDTGDWTPLEDDDRGTRFSIVHVVGERQSLA